MPTFILKIFKFLTDPKNTRMLIFGAFVLLCLLLLRQCNKSQELKAEMEQQKEETTRLLNNEEAKNAKLVESRLGDSSMRATIQGFQLTQEELKNEYSHLMSGFEDVKDQTALALAKGTIFVRETLYVQTQAKIDEYGSGEFTASDTMRVDADNFRILTFHSPFSSKFYQKTDSSEVDFTKYGLFQQMYPGKSKFDIQQSMGIKVGLFQDPKDKKIYIMAQSKYPGVSFSKLEGADIMSDPTSKAAAKNLRSRWGVGISTGLGVVANTNSITPGVYIGIGLNYSPKKLQWGK